MTTVHKRARLLIVEDDRFIRLLYRHLLGSRFDLELVGTVEEALAAAAAKPFDLFLLDINLGESRNGVDLLGLLREMPGYNATPAVACTSYAGQNYKNHCLSCGFDRYVKKPFSRPALLGAVDRALADAGWPVTQAPEAIKVAA